MFRRLSCVSLLVALFITAGCSRVTRDLRTEQPSDVPVPGLDSGPPPEDIVDGVGTIRYVDLEGGFYGIVADDSTKYDPTNLDERFQQDAQRVRFRAVIQRDVLTTRMWGQPVEILEMLPLDL